MGRAEISADLFSSKFQAKGLMQLSKTHCIGGFTELAMGVSKRNKSKGKVQALEELQSKHGTSPLKQGNGQQPIFNANLPLTKRVKRNVANPP